MAKESVSGRARTFPPEWFIRTLPVRMTILWAGGGALAVVGVGVLAAALLRMELTPEWIGAVGQLVLGLAVLFFTLNPAVQGAVSRER